MLIQSRHSMIEPSPSSPCFCLDSEFNNYLRQVRVQSDSTAVHSPNPSVGCERHSVLAHMILLTGHSTCLPSTAHGALQGSARPSSTSKVIITEALIQYELQHDSPQLLGRSRYPVAQEEKGLVPPHPHDLYLQSSVVLALLGNGAWLSWRL